jgi:hypothetical protein
MRKSLLCAVAVLVAAATAYGDLGSVIRSFPIPGGTCGGLARSSSLVYSLYSVSPLLGYVFLMDYETGSVHSFYPAAGGIYTRGLAFQGPGILWQNQAYVTPFLICRTVATNGRIEAYYALPSAQCHGAAPLATGDGGWGTSHIIISNCATRTIYYMTTRGSIVRSHTVSPSLFDIAYDWRNQLIWGGMSSNVCYGVTTTGSTVASFTTPTTNISGITYHGRYLYVAGTSGNIYTIHCPVFNVSVPPTSVGKIKALFE